MLRRLAALAALPIAASAHAQQIEPRSYANAPIGVNFLVAGAVYSRGGLEFDPGLPADNERLNVTTAVLAYARTFGVCGRSGKFDVVVPYGSLSGSVDFAGQHLTRDVSGLLDPTMRTVDVEQFCSWSACRRKMRSSAFTISGFISYSLYGSANIMCRKFAVYLRSGLG